MAKPLEASGAGTAEEDLGAKDQEKKRRKKEKKDRDKREKKRKSSDRSGGGERKKQKAGSTERGGGGGGDAKENVSERQSAKEATEVGAQEKTQPKEGKKADVVKDSAAAKASTPVASAGVAASLLPVKLLARQQEKDRSEIAAATAGKQPQDAKTSRDKPSKEAALAGAKALSVSGLGDIAEMQRRLEDERNKLRLWVIKAKQEWEERHERSSKGQVLGATNDQEYYMASVGEVFGPKDEYRAEGSIGKGVFSSVFRCKHIQGSSEYAVKFVRSNSMMRKAADKEVETYRRLAKLAPREDPEGAQYLMFLAGVETFIHMGHLCMVFELQKCDLRSALQKYGQGRGLPLQTVAQYSRHIFMALRALRKLRVIHGDLKPDNLLMSLAKTEVKLCDFGSAMDVSETLKTAYLQPRYYRAPEVMIGSQYDTQIDLWSAGVTLYELGTGKILLTGKTNNGMLQQMLEVCGAVPKRMALGGNFSSKHFNPDGDFLYRDPDSITGLPELVSMRKFANPLRPVQRMFEKVLKEPPPNADTKTQERLLPRLSDLVAKCLRMDPADRFTPEGAIAHNFHKKDR